MNERIKELIEQVGMTLKARRPYDDNEPNGYMESDLDYFDNNLEATRMFFGGGLEKFAELIVRECAQVASDDDGAHYIGTAIERHFGVEE